ncbi:ead/Ea22-like family protein [Escherichia coli]|nr:ead/Ea22-like family protein [Escherichia coli]
MSKIDYQALREAAEKATCGEWSLEYGKGRFNGDDALIHRKAAGYIPICRIEGAHPESGFDEDFQMEQQANAEFIAAANPATVLALLDERERNQQYIKSRDQENEDIALTVGKLSVELEASENNLIDSECHVAELEEALRDKQALLEASEKRIAELRDWNAGLAQESLTYQQRVAELEVIKSAAEKLVRCKGRYHSEQNYRALAALFGVTVPDLPPLEAESVSQTYKLNELSGNSPVSPGGWISCSERMPNDAQWCVVDAADGYYVQCWSEGQGWLGDDISLRNCDVIRWMAIPEPPEQDGE